MTQGKGDKRRPKFIDETLFESNWQLAFKKNIDAMCEKIQNEVEMTLGIGHEQERNQ